MKFLSWLSGKVTKPVVAWVSGTCAKMFKSEVQFGHAGARSGGEEDSAQGKNAALKAAGAIVPESFEGLEEAIHKTFEELVAEMGSAFLTDHCGLPGVLQHASYIESWLQALRNDKRLIFSAASQAQKAADFLLPQATEPMVQAVAATATA